MTKGKNEAADSGTEKAAKKESAVDETDLPPAVRSAERKGRARMQQRQTEDAPPAARRSGAGLWTLFLLVLFLAFGFAAWSLIQPDITRELAGTFGGNMAGETDISAAVAPRPEMEISPSVLSGVMPETPQKTAAAAIDTATATTPALAGLNEAEIIEIEARLSRIESRLAALDTLVQTTGGDGTATATSLGAMEQRIATLETANRQLHNTEEGMAALVLSVGQLQAVLSSSAPFDRELAALKAVSGRFFAADSALSSALATLSAPAGRGVLTVGELRDTFSALIAAALNAERIAGPEGTEDPGLLAQSWARLRGLVKIRRVGADVPGDTTEAHLARAEALLQKGDLAGALSETKAIEGPAAGPLAAWLADGEARLSVDEEMRAVSSAALAQVTGTGIGAGIGAGTAP